MSSQHAPTFALAAFAVLAVSAFETPLARATIVLGPAANYAVISETGVPHLNLNRATINGNVGIANPAGQLAIQSNGFVHGNVDFAGPVNAAPSPGNVSGALTPNVNLTSAVSSFENLSTTSNTNASGAPIVNLTSGATIDITTGKLVGQTYYFNLGSVSLSGGPVTISGAAAPAGFNVVFNSTSNVNFNGGVNISGGLTTDSVLFNVVGGHSITTATNGGSISGIFLDPTGTISLDNTVLNGRIYGGDSNDLGTVSGTTVNGPATVPEPSTFAIAATVAVASLGYWVRRRNAQPPG